MGNFQPTKKCTNNHRKKYISKDENVYIKYVIRNVTKCDTWRQHWKNVLYFGWRIPVSKRYNIYVILLPFSNAASVLNGKTSIKLQQWGTNSTHSATLLPIKY